MSYIKREFALSAVQNLPSAGGCSAVDRDDAENAILNIPAADVVEVVRCRDCKYSEIDENGNLWCAFYNGKIREMPNGYCWHGERREG